MKRKIIRQGNNTLTITLPREWTKKYNIQPGQELHIIQNDSSIVLNTESLPTTTNKILNITNLTKILPLIMVSLYRNGYSDIELQFENPHTTLVINNIINTLPGFRLSDHGKTYCKLHIAQEKINAEELLRKIMYNIKLQFSSIIDEENPLQTLLSQKPLTESLFNLYYRSSNHPHLLITPLEQLNNQLQHMVDEDKIILQHCAELYTGFCKNYNAPEKLLAIQQDLKSLKYELSTQEPSLPLHNLTLLMDNLFTTAIIASL